MPEPIVPQPQQGSWADLVLPFAIGAGSLAAGFGAGRNPGVDNPGAAFLQPLQTMSLLDYRTGLTQHYRDLTAYQQAEEQRKLADQQRQIEEFTWKKADAERQRRISEANEQRKATGFTQSQALLQRFGLGGGGIGRGQASPPEGLPPVTSMGPGMLQPPQASLPASGGGQVPQYRPKFNIGNEGVTTTLEESPETINWNNAAVIAKNNPGLTQAKAYEILSGVSGKLPSNIDIAEKGVQNALTLVGKFDMQSATYVNVRDAWGRMREVAANPNPQEPSAGDMALMYSYIRMLDPNTGVKEGEYATIQNAPALPERIRNLYNKVLEGSKLPPQFKSELLGKSEQMYMSALKRQDLLERQFNKQIGQISSTYKTPINITAPDLIGEDRAYLTGKRPHVGPSTLPAYPSGEAMDVQKPQNVIRFDRGPDGRLIQK